MKRITVEVEPFAEVDPAFVAGLADLNVAIQTAIHGPDEYVPIKKLLRLYPRIPDRRWVYSRQGRFGARKVEGKKSVVFSLRAVQAVLGPPA